MFAQKLGVKSYQQSSKEDRVDGADLATAFVQAEMPPETNGVILTGPLMTLEQRQRLHQFAAKHPRLQVLEDMTRRIRTDTRQPSE